MSDEPTIPMIQAGLNAATLGDDYSFAFDYITCPDRTDPDWKAIGGYPDGHPSHAEDDWRWHIVKRIIQAAMDARALGQSPQAKEV